MKSRRNNPDQGSQAHPTSWRTWLLIVASGLFLIFAILLSILKEPPSTWLPVNLHSVLFADYSQDPRGQLIPRVRFSVIREKLEDITANLIQTGTASPDERYADVLQEMQTPVATVTPLPGATVFVPTPQRSSTPTALTPTGTASATPTGTASATPTGTFFLTPSPTATQGGVYPTATYQPSTQVPLPTRTRPPAATNTSVPTPTQPPPTQPPTQPPPTATPRPTQPPTSTPKPTNPSYPPPYP